ncbi:MAG: restriction endonuclease subunit M [Odoribacter sp.]|nr:restriction endonuclease subunit M [Odoribacter sp.]
MQFKQAYNRANFLHFLESDFLPEDFLSEVEPINFESNYTRNVTRLGECKSLGLDVFEVQHTSTHDARVGLSKEAFRLLYNRSTKNKALVLFVPIDNKETYRFSLVAIEVELDEYKIRKSFSNPRRYSYLLGEEAKVHTPTKYLSLKGRVKDAKDLQDRFSVEVLTKEFYNELSNWYAWVIEHVQFPSQPVGKSEDEIVEHKSKNVIRLLTRLLFVWFLKQKHLIPDQFFDEAYLNENLLVDFAPNQQVGLFSQKNLDSKYYKAILQNLFFAMLNCPITPQSKEDNRERGFRKNDNWGQHRDANFLMRYENLFKDSQLFLSLANEKVPFLNGGLFDCLDNKSAEIPIYIDGFSDNLPSAQKLIVPDYLFFGEELGKAQDLSKFYGDKKKKQVNAKGLIDILKTYNFTIEENTPYDQEVSLDPELLGKVFENLLASYNPETKTTARKQTGSFYTPREIVQYMVDESLVAHLRKVVGEELEPEYRKLMSFNENDLNLTIEQRKTIIQALFECKIIDPACGSGAFPVGILQQMVHILRKLDEKNETWKEILISNAITETNQVYREATNDERAEMVAEIERNFNNDLNRPDYARKLYLVENCIYGVDIQPIAVQISKLRFFISLVVEQDATNDNNDNFGIRPLPNLEAKFVSANALIGVDRKKQQLSLFENQEVKAKENELKLIRHKLFSAKNPSRKRKLCEQDKEVRSIIAELLQNSHELDNQSALQLANWDPYDQNVSSPFFDTGWMFGLKNGFDIVIANPPYIGSKGNEKIFQDVCKTDKGLSYFSRWMDYFYFFFHIGFDFLAEDGVICFITTNYFYTATGADKLRSLLKKNAIEMLTNFNELKIFESAVGQHNAITLIRKRKTTKNSVTKVINVNKKGTANGFDLKLIFSQNDLNTSYNTIQTEKLFEGIDNQIRIQLSMPINNDCLDVDGILNKVALGVSPLSDYCNITMGIVTLSDTISNKHLSTYNLLEAKKGDGVYVLNGKELELLGLDDKAKETFIKPFYKNSDIKRYYSKSESDLYLIYTKDQGKPIKLPIGIQKHFEKFKPLIVGLKENFLKNKIAAAVVLKWFKNGNYFVLFTPKKQSYFIGEKIITSYRSKTNSFTYNDVPWYASKDVAYILPRNGTVNLRFITAILNSKLIYAWLLFKGKKKGDILELYKKPLSEIPIKIASNQQPFIELVDQILVAKQDNLKADTSALENRIDKLVYELYGLTEEEIKIVEGS